MDEDAQSFLIEIPLTDLPVGEGVARKALVRPGAFLALVELEKDDALSVCRADLDKRIFIDSLPWEGLQRDSRADHTDQIQAVCAAVSAFLKGPGRVAYAAPARPITVTLQPGFGPT